MRRALLTVAALALLAGAGGLLMAQTPARTSTSSGDTSRVAIGPAGAGAEAFVAWPAGKADAPAVIVIHESWGLNAQIRGVARRFAAQGYVAIVPDLYHGKSASDPEDAKVLMRGLDEAGALRDLDATVAWLRAQPRTAKARIGVVGFGMGGTYSQRFALRSPEVAVAVMFYGAPETDPAKLATLKAPLQGHFGATDPGIEVSRVDALRAALDQAGKANEIHVYGGAGHAFMDENRPSYAPDAARQAWARTLSFLQKHLKR